MISKKTPKFSARRWFAMPILVVAVAIMTVVGLGLTSPASASSASLSANAESGDLTGWGTTLNASASTSAHYHGADGYRLDNSGGTGAYLNWTNTQIEQGHEWASISFWFKVNSRGASQTTDLASVKSVSGVNNFDMFLLANGHLAWDLLSTNSGQTTGTLSLNTWHLAEARVDYGGATGTTYNAYVQIDGVDQGMISSTGQTPSTVKSMWLGTSLTTKTFVTDYDDVTLNVGDSDPGYEGNAPTSAFNATGCS